MGPVWGWYRWEGEAIRRGCRRCMWWRCYVLMHENGKMRPVKLFQEWERVGIKEDEGGGEFNYDIL
jgi:hypothetical protein